MYNGTLEKPEHVLRNSCVTYRKLRNEPTIIPRIKISESAFSRFHGQ